jgi:peptidoglycan/xylan/chitin deacetylase (PgdA/CDA1 family)
VVKTLRVASATALVLVAVTTCSSRGRDSAQPTTAAARARQPAPPTAPRFVHPHNRPVPILNYHVIGTPPGSAPFPELYVSRSDFEAQLRWLRRHGYQAVSLRRVYDYWRRGLALPPRPIVLSFDDGYREDFTNARPLLRRFGWPGVLNLAVQNVLDRKLSIPQLRQLVRSGWEIDAHSLTHPDLTTLDRRELHRQVSGSRLWIRRRLGVPAAFFCYPAGVYDRVVVQAVRRAGFRGATTTRPGFASPRDGLFTLNRIRVNAGDGVSGLAARLTGFSGENRS